MRSVYVSAAVVLVFGWSGVTVRADDKVNESKKALGQLQGTWKLTSYEVQGEKYEDEGETEFTFSKNNLMVLQVHEPYSTMFTWYRVEVDPDTTPRCIDTKIVFSNGGLLNASFPLLTDAGKTREGIYELKGDTLRICLNWPSLSERPQKFETSREAKGLVFYELKRMKDKDD